MIQNKNITHLLAILLISLLFICSSAYAYEEGELEQPWQKQVQKTEESKGTKRADQSNDAQSKQKTSDQSDSDNQSDEENNEVIHHDDTRDHEGL
ncbi:hypothetical protein [Nitrosomonas sp.]|uniref:hypothetical protein n=1 Tax=Nitrosomonas sp. TaxID=42353 RepID=UPI00208AF10B|nr:hypothetical protein [Nitrosomonas sp.]GJL74771.1 MAG: hypothetical protein NMNS02_08770 [Nitrosomonas sp.]